jgi:hypothetical protein
MANAIRLIDKKIHGIRLELYRRVGRFNTFSAHDWQLAWDRNPDLQARENALFLLRDIAVQEFTELLEKEYRKAQRAERRAVRAGKYSLRAA